MRHNAIRLAQQCGISYQWDHSRQSERRDWGGVLRSGTV